VYRDVVKAYRRTLLLLLFLPIYAFGLAMLSQAAAMLIVDFDDMSLQQALSLDDVDHGYFWFYFGGPAILVAVTQVLFLLPVVKRPVRMGSQGKPLVLSLIVIGVVASGLATGLLLACMELVRLLLNKDPGLEIDGTSGYVTWILIPLLASWTFWTILIIRFAHRRPPKNPRVLRRAVGWLLGATILEVIVVLPLDIMVRRRTDCYCDTGTAHTLGLSAWALMWLSGPGIVLAVLSKRRQLWSDLYCPGCGYEKGPSPGEKCPECAHSWVHPGAA